MEYLFVTELKKGKLKDLKIRYIYSPRKKKLELVPLSRSLINVYGPHITEKDLQLFIRINVDSIYRLISSLPKGHQPVELIKGDTFLLLGKYHKVSSVEALRNIDIGTLKQSNVSYIKKMRSTYNTVLSNIVPDMLSVLAEQLEVNPDKVYYKYSRKSWGRAVSRLNEGGLYRYITINSFLGALRPELVNLVVSHEMVHFIHRKHDKDFYNLLSKFEPDHRELAKELSGFTPILYT